MKKLSVHKGGGIELIPQTSDDMWDLYNCIVEGDEVKCKTTRKINSGDGGKPMVKTLNIAVEVNDVDYDHYMNEIRVSGPCCTTNDFIQRGRFHTLKLSVDLPFILFKKNSSHDSYDIQRLENACKRTITTCMHLILMIDHGHAILYNPSETMLSEVGNVKMTMPKQSQSTPYASQQYKFHKQLLQLILTLDLQKIESMIFAGPGTAKELFKEFILKHATESAFKNIEKLKLKVKNVPLISCSSISKACLTDILTNNKCGQTTLNTNLRKQEAAMNMLWKNINNNPDLVCMGIAEVKCAADQMAIKTLVVSEKLLRSTDWKVTRQIIELVTKSKGEVCLVPGSYSMTTQLEALNGIAAILRYACDLEKQ